MTTSAGKADCGTQLVASQVRTADDAVQDAHHDVHNGAHRRHHGIAIDELVADIDRFEETMLDLDPEDMQRLEATLYSMARGCLESVRRAYQGGE